MTTTTEAVPTSAEARCLRFAAGQPVARRRLNDAALGRCLAIGWIDAEHRPDGRYRLALTTRGRAALRRR